MVSFNYLHLGNELFSRLEEYGGMHGPHQWPTPSWKWPDLTVHSLPCTGNLLDVAIATLPPVYFIIFVMFSVLLKFSSGICLAVMATVWLVC